MKDKYLDIAKKYKRFLIPIYKIYNIYRWLIRPYKIYLYTRSREIKKLHIGCGPHIIDGWLNADFIRGEIFIDAKNKLPFKSNTFDIIFNDHFLEHLEYRDELPKFLKDCIRILKPGGIISIGVPDTEIVLISYVKGDDTYFNLAKKLWHPSWCQTKMEHINYHFRQDGEHKFAYDFETLKKVLSEKGFVEIEKREFNQSKFAELNVSREERRMGTIYVDAMKPKDINGVIHPREE